MAVSLLSQKGTPTRIQDHAIQTTNETLSEMRQVPLGMDATPGEQESSGALPQPELPVEMLEGEMA